MIQGRWIRFVLCLTLTAACAAPLSCGKKKADENAGERALKELLESATGEEGDVAIDGEDVSIQADETSPEAELAAEWPSAMFEGVPRFEFGEIERVTSATQTGTRKFNIWYRNVPEYATERLRSELEEQGWEPQTALLGPNASMISAKKGRIGVQFMHSQEEKTGVFVAIEMPE